MNDEKNLRGICPVCLQPVNVISDSMDITAIVCQQKLDSHPESPLHDLLNERDPCNCTISFHLFKGRTCQGYNCMPVKILG